MGQRGVNAAFMPSKYVFPGGAVDASDAELTLDLALDPLSAFRLRLDCFTPSPAPNTIAAAALRELHEETGLRLTETGHSQANLRFVFRAITPPGRSRRFDARFLLADATLVLGDAEDFSAASDELSHLHWIGLDRARALDLPFITEVVLAEVSYLLRGGSDVAGVPFFDNSGPTPAFRRLV